MIPKVQQFQGKKEHTTPSPSIRYVRSPNTFRAVFPNAACESPKDRVRERKAGIETYATARQVFVNLEADAIPEFKIARN